MMAIIRRNFKKVEQWDIPITLLPCTDHYLARGTSSFSTFFFNELCRVIVEITVKNDCPAFSSS
jgi:hypothetical protein